MKKILIYLMLTVLLCACNKQDDTTDYTTDYTTVVGDVINIRVGIVLVDEAFNDRLNPESPAYFGDEYTNGIEMLYLCEGKKCTAWEYYRLSGGGSWFFIDDIENLKPIIPPVKLKEGFDYSDYEPLQYYYIDASSSGAVYSIGFAPVIEEEREVTYTYIRYPDGSEDEIKAQLFRNESRSILVIDKLWVNGELACYMGTWDDPKTGVKGDRYYNPKYYPWMKPVIDDDGNQIGIMPKYGNIMVLTK